MGASVEADPLGPDKGTISIGLVHEAVQVARQRGLPVETMLSACGIPPEWLGLPLARVPADAYARLWAALADAMDDEFFGMDRHPMRRGSYRLMCQAALGSDTLGHALQRMLAFLRCVLDELHGELQREGDTARLVLHDTGGPHRMFAYATWLMLVHGLACWLVGRRLPLTSAGFRCAEPGDPAEVADYRTRFCEVARFDAPCTQVTFEARLLDLVPVQREATLRVFLREAPANLLVRYRNEASIALRIRRELRRLPPALWPDVETLARGLRTSATTLQRRLHEEGQSYQRLKDALRRDQATELLAGTPLPAAAIAERLGFEEPSAFHRAFKKWTGMSPGAYRRSLVG